MATTKKPQAADPDQGAAYDSLDTTYETLNPPAEMPERFSTGGATAEERDAWIAEHGNPA